jgi:hypothetical protein
LNGSERIQYTPRMGGTVESDQQNWNWKTHGASA